jgi:hypothetical protein
VTLHRRQRHRACTGLLLACTFAVVACSGRSGDAAGGATPGVTRTGTVAPVDRPSVGPFKALGWSGRPAADGALLHDDGRRLWSIDLAGRRTMTWRHPPANVTSVAAAPGGAPIALAVAAEPRRASDASFYLYELEVDGTIRLLDITHTFRTIDSPLYLRPPTSRATAAPQPYWLRVGEKVDGHGRLETEAMTVGDGGRETVFVPLRYTEAVFDVEGYPGGRTFTLTLFRQNDVPTRAEILRNDDAAADVAGASATIWGNDESRAQTDVLTGVAWTSPTDYVVPVAQRNHRAGYSLRLFRVGCEAYGSHVAYRGRGIDWGYADAPWRILPAGPGHVLVLGADDGRRLRAGVAISPSWRSVDIRTGALTRTSVAWESGAWSWVVPDDAGDVRTGRCEDLSWRWP